MTQKNKEIVTAVGTLSLAVVIGFFMQKSDNAEEFYGGNAKPAGIETPLKGASLAPEVSDIRLTSAVVPTVRSAGGKAISADHLVLHRQIVTETVRPSSETCEIAADAIPAEAGLVTLAINAPCLPDARVVVHHNGLVFAEKTDPEGVINIKAPALTEKAVYILAFANGEGAVVQTTVPSVRDLGRAVLQWRGDVGLELHAREFGADYGSDGHIWHGMDKASVDEAETRGSMIRLGNANVLRPRMAEVYTYPMNQSAISGTIDLTIETEITFQNCGLDIEAQSIELNDSALKTQEVILSVPDCTAVGSFLVLNNLISDLDVAMY